MEDIRHGVKMGVLPLTGGGYNPDLEEGRIAKYGRIVGDRGPDEMG